MRCHADHIIIDPDWRGQVESRIGASGMRRSAARCAILDWIAAGPFTAEVVAHQVPTGSRTTVYRTLPAVCM
ncbi:MAG: hypothetical protein HC828_00585 [Blastochloris sp.]|nr:hypothetical protein [Blastochloris sp.]